MSRIEQVVWDIAAGSPMLAARSMCQMLDSNLLGALPLHAKRSLHQVDLGSPNVV